MKYHLGAVHIKNNFVKTTEEVSALLSTFCKENSIDYYEREIDITSINKREKISCFWCSWNRRKAIFLLSKEENYNKIAFGHHLDDIIETQVMNLFFHGEISTMPVKLSMFGGELELIRPLAYIPEKKIIRFVKQFDFDFKGCTCPNQSLSKRKAVREIIEKMYGTNRAVKVNIFRSLRNIKEGYLNKI